MTINGYWFEPHVSTRHNASLQLLGEQYVLSSNGSTLRSGPCDDFVISDRLGSMPRRLVWRDEAAFETTENDAIDEWLNQVQHGGSRSLFLHRLERSWIWAVAGVVLTAAVVFSSFRWGLPSASRHIAHKLPVSVHESVSRETLKALDEYLFDTSETPNAEQAAVRSRFEALVSSLPENDFTFVLHFRQMGGVPNAMALPAGDIVVTDALLELAKNSDEVDSVLLHEIGHVLEQHGLQQVIRSSAISVVVALAFGDLSGAGELGVGLPAFLLQSSYSRQLETEADSFAFARMGELGMDPAHFASMITRLAGQKEGDQSSNDYFSSHPHAAERARNAREASRQLGF